MAQGYYNGKKESEQPCLQNLLEETKANQKELLAAMSGYVKRLKPVNQEITFNKGHGGIEKREYKHYAISGQYVDSPWRTSGFKSLFKVKRWRFDLTGVEQSCQVCYSISNGGFDKNEDYFSAIREHWSVETNNHIRTKEKAVTGVLSVCRTLIIKLLKKTKTKNMLAQIQLFQDKFSKLLHWLRSINCL